MTQEDKFLSIGKASANLIHELRKPLSVILTYIQFCVSKLPMDESLKERLNIGLLRFILKHHTSYLNLLSY